MSASLPLSILVLEDDEGLRSQYRWLLSEYLVLPAGDRLQANEIVRRDSPALAIVDLGLPPDENGVREGLAAVSDILTLAPDTKVIVVSGNEDRAHASAAVASGAYDFFQKPADPDLLKLIVGRAAQLYQLERDNRRLSEAVPRGSAVRILGDSAAMQKVLRDIERLAKTDITVLITGESGTGKELVADAIHKFSSRSRKPFVAINCAAIPEGLLEAELFGHERGAFTGAVKQTIGKIESAKGGTLFLDEVGDIPLGTQVKLLRFLEDRMIERVGGRNSIRVDVRILSATNQTLPKLITEGRFREDLFYRLNEVHLDLPPLRERANDSVVLASFFLRKYAKEFGRPLRGFTSGAMDEIQRHPWRGNVRELEGRIKRATIMAEGTQVTAADLDLVRPPEEPVPLLRDARRQAESHAIRLALSRAGGNVSKAANLLGISRPTLYDLLNDHGIAATRLTSKTEFSKGQ